MIIIKASALEKWKIESGHISHMIGIIYANFGYYSYTNNYVIMMVI